MLVEGLNIVNEKYIGIYNTKLAQKLGNTSRIMMKNEKNDNYKKLRHRSMYGIPGHAGKYHPIRSNRN